MPLPLALLVEDDQVLSHTITRNLEVRNIEVAHAATVEGALLGLNGRQPALVLLDIELPDGSGWDVLRALRSAGNTAPVIVMSAFRPNMRLSGEFGCVGVLEKPFPMDSLLRMVMEHLNAPGLARKTDAWEGTSNAL